MISFVPLTSQVDKTNFDMKNNHARLFCDNNKKGEKKSLYEKAFGLGRFQSSLLLFFFFFE